MDLLRFASCLCSLLLLPASQTLRIFARLASHALVATSQSQNPHRLLAQHSSPRIPTPLTRPAVVPCPPVTKIITVITRNYTSLSPPHVMKAAFPSLAGSAFAWLPPYIQIASEWILWIEAAFHASPAFAALGKSGSYALQVLRRVNLKPTAQNALAVFKAVLSFQDSKQDLPLPTAASFYIDCITLFNTLLLLVIAYKFLRAAGLHLPTSHAKPRQLITNTLNPNFLIRIGRPSVLVHILTTTFLLPFCFFSTVFTMAAVFMGFAMEYLQKLWRSCPLDWPEWAHKYHSRLTQCASCSTGGELGVGHRVKQERNIMAAIVGPLPAPALPPPSVLAPPSRMTHLARIYVDKGVSTDPESEASPICTLSPIIIGVDMPPTVTAEEVEEEQKRKEDLAKRKLDEANQRCVDQIKTDRYHTKMLLHEFNVERDELNREKGELKRENEMLRKTVEDSLLSADKTKVTLDKVNDGFNRLSIAYSKAQARIKALEAELEASRGKKLSKAVTALDAILSPSKPIAGTTSNLALSTLSAPNGYAI